MLTQTLARERSYAGAAFFDVAFPLWHSCIKTECLSIAHSDSCILGQMYGTFDNGQRYFRITEKQAEEFGLLISPGKEKTEGYRLLTEAWLERIAERRMKANVSCPYKEGVYPQSKWRRAIATATTAALSILCMLFSR